MSRNIIPAGGTIFTTECNVELYFAEAIGYKADLMLLMLWICKGETNRLNHYMSGTRNGIHLGKRGRERHHETMTMVAMMAMVAATAFNTHHSFFIVLPVVSFAFFIVHSFLIVLVLFAFFVKL